LLTRLRVPLRLVVAGYLLYTRGCLVPFTRLHTYHVGYHVVFVSALVGLQQRWLRTLYVCCCVYLVPVVVRCRLPRFAFVAVGVYVPSRDYVTVCLVTLLPRFALYAFVTLRARCSRLRCCCGCDCPLICCYVALGTYFVAGSVWLLICCGALPCLRSVLLRPTRLPTLTFPWLLTYVHLFPAHVILFFAHRLRVYVTLFRVLVHVTFVCVALRFAVALRTHPLFPLIPAFDSRFVHSVYARFYARLRYIRSGCLRLHLHARYSRSRVVCRHAHFTFAVAHAFAFCAVALHVLFVRSSSFTRLVPPRLLPFNFVRLRLRGYARSFYVTFCVLLRYAFTYRLLRPFATRCFGRSRLPLRFTVGSLFCRLHVRCYIYTYRYHFTRFGYFTLHLPGLRYCTLLRLHFVCSSYCI